MRGKTKKKRITIALGVLKKNQGEKFSIDVWLKTINNELPELNSFRSTKQLAQVFRYIKSVMHENLVKKKEIRTYEFVKMQATYYTLMPHLENENERLENPINQM